MISELPDSEHYGIGQTSDTLYVSVPLSFHLYSTATHLSAADKINISPERMDKDYGTPHEAEDPDAEDRADETQKLREARRKIVCICVLMALVVIYLISSTLQDILKLVKRDRSKFD